MPPADIINLSNLCLPTEIESFMRHISVLQMQGSELQKYNLNLLST